MLLENPEGIEGKTNVDTNLQCGTYTQAQYSSSSSLCSYSYNFFALVNVYIVDIQRDRQIKHRFKRVLSVVVYCNFPFNSFATPDQIFIRVTVKRRS